MEELNQNTEESIQQENEVVVEPVLSLTATSLEMLIQASKWSQILAVLGFISLGFMCLGGLFFTIIFSFIPKTFETRCFR